jgi:REP element-mobilizing transposase RayT
VRVRPGVPPLRTRRFLREFSRTLRASCERGEFRVAHYSIQRDHVHLIIEAAGKEALARGMKSIAARIARAVNRVFAREGPALFGRYHLRALRTPREVRNALAYVLLNARKHWRERHGSPPPERMDEASSGRWFDGWRRAVGLLGWREPPDVARPHTWLLRVGWRRHGLIDPAEVPKGLRKVIPRRTAAWATWKPSG